MSGYATGRELVCQTVKSTRITWEPQRHTFGTHSAQITAQTQANSNTTTIIIIIITTTTTTAIFSIILGVYRVSLYYTALNFDQFQSFSDHNIMSQDWMNTVTTDQMDSKSV